MSLVANAWNKRPHLTSRRAQGLILTAVLVIIVTHGANLPANPKQSNDISANNMTARQFILLDDKGRKRIELGFHKSISEGANTPGIVIYDEQEQPRIELALHNMEEPSEEAFLGFRDKSGDYRIIIHSAHNWPNIILSGPEESALKLGLGPRGESSIEMEAKDGDSKSARVDLGLTPQKGFSWTIRDTKGEERLLLRTNWNESPMLTLRDKEQNVFWRAKKLN